MNQYFHTHIRVKTFLEMGSKEFYDNWYGSITDDSGLVLTFWEMKKAIQEEADKGYVVIPCGPCDNFDYSGKGCLGHKERE